MSIVIAAASLFRGVYLIQIRVPVVVVCASELQSPPLHHWGFGFYKSSLCRMIPLRQIATAAATQERIEQDGLLFSFSLIELNYAKLFYKCTRFRDAILAYVYDN